MFTIHLGSVTPHLPLFIMPVQLYDRNCLKLITYFCACRSALSKLSNMSCSRANNAYHYSAVRFTIACFYTIDLRMSTCLCNYPPLLCRDDIVRCDGDHIPQALYVTPEVPHLHLKNDNLHNNEECSSLHAHLESGGNFHAGQILVFGQLLQHKSVAN